jgi:hypothetical protein
MSSEAIMSFRETYERNPHFLAQGKELGYSKPKFPGVSAGHEADAEEPDDDERDARAVETRCASCAEKNTVAPPDGYTLEFSTKENDNDGRVAFKCRACGESQTLRHHRARKIQESATSAFHAASREGDRPRIAAGDALGAFIESYDGPSRGVPVSAVLAIARFFDVYRRR